MTLPAAYQGLAQAGAVWLPATPADGLERGPWWTLFADPELDRLATEVALANPNIAAAAANFAQAQAFVREQRAALFPSVSADAGARRRGGRSRTAQAGTDLEVGVASGWEPDFWGRLRNSVTVASASAQAVAADLASAQLSSQAELATNYFALRAADAEIALLDSTLEGYGRSLQITRNRYAAGVIARTDVLQAEVQHATTRADMAALQGQRRRLEHAIAVLTGRSPADFTLPATPWRGDTPVVPVGVPSTLLQRRPDIAAAERDVAAANARIGIQRAAYFPNVSLSASLGNAAASFGSLFSASTLLWSLGISVAQNVFDAGATRARVDAAAAGRDAAVARYRQTVLSAFQEVEDQLTAASVFAEQEGLRREASAAADAIERQVMNRYRAGQLSYTDVVTAQVAALGARRNLLRLALDRQAGAVSLIRALGGGWQADSAPVR